MSSEDAVENLVTGTNLWFKDDNGAWVSGKLISKDGANITISSNANGSKVVRGNAAVHPANPAELDIINDLCQLTYLNEPTVLHNLFSRFKEDSIYTFAGPVLIAVNPCKRLPLYTAEIAAQYTGGKSSLDLQFGNINITSNEPHIYLVSAKAFQAMVRDQRSQSLIVSGESGAGKTETTKKAMQYFTSLAGGNGIEDQVMETNPILEAFGNAKTSRNNNSSRFGKLIKILFNNTHHICGAAIETYLLEKSRVVAQLPGERNYHIFYQLVKGASKEQQEKFHLPDDPNAFRILSVSGCTDIDGVDDAADFKEVLHALSAVGISAEQQEALLRLVAAVLWLGNVELSEDDEHGVTVKDNEAADKAADLLGCTKAALENSLTKRTLSTRDGPLLRSNNLMESCDARDAMAKAIYSALFTWLVEQVNCKLAAGRKAAGLFIAILDIFGFEQFQRNSFEQLCINYTNERLQGQFNRHYFQQQQEEYREEGLQHVEVAFENNQPTVDLLEAKRGQGILSVLDSQCNFPGSTDDSFVQALRQNLSSSRLGFDRRASHVFTVTHYAGTVGYDSSGFIEKNKDTLSGDLVELMQISSLPLLADLGQVLGEQAGGGKGKATVGTRFSGQLGNLMTGLDLTGLHFIRCIKPNPQLAADAFAHDMVEAQLRSCGVLEVVRLAKAGYPSRYEFATFAERYTVLSHNQQEVIREGETAKDAVMRLLADFNVKEDQYVLGTSKVFFRPGVVGRVEVQWAYQMRMSALLQTQCRCWRWHTWFRNLRRAAITVQSAIRVKLAQQEHAELKWRNDAAIKIQRAIRSRRMTAKWHQIIKARTVLRMFTRRWRLHHRIAQRVHIRESAELQAQLAAEEEKRREASFSTLQQQYGLSIDQVREAVERYVSGVHPPTPPVAMSPVEAPTTPQPTSTRTIPDPAFAPAPAAAPTAAAAAPSSTMPDSVRLRLENLYMRQKLRLQTGLREQYAEKAREKATADLASQVRELQSYITTLQASAPGTAPPPPPKYIDVNATLAAATAAATAAAAQPALSAAEVAAAAVPSGMVKARLENAKAGTVEGVVVGKMVEAPCGKAVGEGMLQFTLETDLGAVREELEDTSRVLDGNADFLKEEVESAQSGNGGRVDTETEYIVLESQYKVWSHEFQEKLKGLRRLIRGDRQAGMNAIRQRFESMKRV